MVQANENRHSGPLTSQCPFVARESDPVARIATGVVRLSKRLAQIKHQASATVPGIDSAGFPLLFTLAHGPRRISGLAELVYSDVSTVSRQVAALERHGLVERTPDPDDRRASLLALTETGAATINGIVERRYAHTARVVADWPAEDVATFAELLARFETSVGEYAEHLFTTPDNEARTTPPMPDPEGHPK